MTTIDLARVRGIAADWKQSPYYDRAEEQDWLAPFWDEGTPFRASFAQLDLTSTLELACGHGRHAAQVLEGRSGARPGRMVLMDVNHGNVAYCRKRFRRNDVQVWRNSGLDYYPVPASSITAIFCYDAMVHFEYDCVISYLYDTTRVLRIGGKALFHHSNYAAPGSYWAHNPHSRNFMTKDLFAHIAQRAGLDVVQQQLLDWGEGPARVEAIDCLTLLQKTRPTPSRTRNLLRHVVARLP